MLLLISAFMVCTLLVAQSDSLPELVFYRFLQGVSAAGMGPLSNQVMLATYPKEMHGAAEASRIIGCGGRGSDGVVSMTRKRSVTNRLYWYWRARPKKNREIACCSVAIEPKTNTMVPIAMLPCCT